MTDPRVPPNLDRAAAVAWRLLIIAVAVLAVGFVFLRLRLVVLPLIAALLIATLLQPPVQRLKEKRWPPALAAWTVYLPVLAALVAFGMFLVPQLADEFSELGDQFSQGVEQVRDYLTEGPFHFSDQQIDSALDRARESMAGDDGALTSRLVSGAMLVVEILAGIVLVLVLTFFFIKDGDEMAQWAVDQFDESIREDVRAMGGRAWEALRGYVKGSAIDGVIEATFTGVALAIIGIPLVLPIAVLFFFGAFFPLVGVFVAGAVAVLVALVAGGFSHALLTLAVVIATQQLEENVLQPIVLGRAVSLHPVVIMLALTGGGIIAGLMGAFLAVPVTAAATAMANEFKIRRADSEAAT